MNTAPCYGQYGVVAYQVLRAPMGLDQLDAHFEQWQRWLDSPQPVVLLSIFEAESVLQPSSDVSARVAIWLQAQQSQLRERLLAMASVVPSSTLLRLQGIDFLATFGVPGGLYDQIEPAYACLLRHVHRAGIHVATLAPSWPALQQAIGKCRR